MRRIYVDSQLNAFYNCNFVLHHLFKNTGKCFAITLKWYYQSHGVI